MDRVVPKSETLSIAPYVDGTIDLVICEMLHAAMLWPPSDHTPAMLLATF